MKKVLILLSLTCFIIGCGLPSREEYKKRATEVVKHNDKAIIIEILHDGYIGYGVFKVTVDSNVYVVVNNDGTAIIKHN